MFDTRPCVIIIWRQAERWHLNMRSRLVNMRSRLGVKFKYSSFIHDIKKLVAKGEDQRFQESSKLKWHPRYSHSQSSVDRDWCGFWWFRWSGQLQCTSDFLLHICTLSLLCPIHRWQNGDRHAWYQDRWWCRTLRLRSLESAFRRKPPNKKPTASAIEWK